MPQLPLTRRTFLAGTGLVLLAPSGVLLPRTAGAATAKVGAAAPAFTVGATTGKSVTLADYKGQLVVLEWTNHECPYVRKHYESGRDWEPFSAARLAELRAAGTPVFVNVTAAWCLTCLVNERVALRSTTVTEAFARKRVVRLKADWTTRDPVITRVLGAFGRSGVPLYLLYPAGAAGDPAVLPQILSERLVLDATERL